MAGSDQQDVPFPDGHPLLGLGCLQLIAKDVLPRLEPRDPSESRNVEQDAPSDQTVLQDLDRLGRGTARGDGVRGFPVVERSLVADVREGVDVRMGVAVVVDTHVVLGEANGIVAAPRRHVMVRGPRVVRRRGRVQRPTERDGDPLTHEPGSRSDALGRDAVQRAALVVLSPFPPGTHSPKESLELLSGDVHLFPQRTSEHPQAHRRMLHPVGTMHDRDVLGIV